MRSKRIPGARVMAGVVLPAVAALFFGACNREQLLSVQTPDQITVDKANNVAGAQALRVAAIGTMYVYFAGDNGGGGVGMNIATGLLSDEMFAARGGTEHLDSRALQETQFPVTSPWGFYGTAETQIIRAIKALNQYAAAGATKVTQIGQLYALQGMLFVITAEGYCNGIPVADANDANPTTVNLTNAQMYTLAISQFDTALTMLSASAADLPLRNLSRVGKARAWVNLNDYAKAAQIVGAGGDGAGSAAVPTSFVYNAEFSKLTTSTVNDVYDWMLATRNFGASDKEGINGLDYVSSHDPRVRVDGTKLGAGQDGTPTPTINQFPSTDSPVPLASGIEARLIEAEAQLKTSDAVSFMATLNAARTTLAGLAPLVDPGTTDARVNLLFRERAFWMYMTSHRLGDMRRLLRQYSRAAETVFPTGPYLHGGRYGPDVTLIPAQAERNNTAWTGCADRNP
jgi:hypothetical protein